MPLALDTPPSPGEPVRVRQRRYLVESVLPAPRPDDQTLVRLSCLEDDAEGEELEVIWEKELDARRFDATDWTKPAQGSYDNAWHFAAYFHMLRWNAVSRPAALSGALPGRHRATPTGLTKGWIAKTHHGSFDFVAQQPF